MRAKYTNDQRDEALRLLAEHGKAEAARRTGIPSGTISSWGVRHGVNAPPAERTRVATEARLATMADRKAALASGLLDDIERLRSQLFAPCVERKAVIVSDGPREGSHVEVADVDLGQPSFVDQKAIVVACAVAVDKVQLLTGEATVRTEMVSVERTLEHEAEIAKVLHLVRSA